MLILTLGLCVWVCASSRYTTINQAIISPGSYSQLLINPIRMFSDEFDPGQIQLTLNMSTTQQPYDVLLFSSVDSSSYQCYINTISMNQLSQECFEEMGCVTCDNGCQKKISDTIHEILVNNERGNQLVCCLACNNLTMADPITINLDDIKTNAPILLIDNTNLPNQQDLPLHDVNITISVEVYLKSDQRDYHLALILIFAFIFMIGFLTTILCILNHKYKNAKEKQHGGVGNSIMSNDEKKPKIKDV